MRTLTLDTCRFIRDDDALASHLPLECSFVSQPLLFVRPLHVERLVVGGKPEDGESEISEEGNTASHTRWTVEIKRITRLENIWSQRKLGSVPTGDVNQS